MMDWPEKTGLNLADNLYCRPRANRSCRALRRVQQRATTKARWSPIRSSQTRAGDFTLNTLAPLKTASAHRPQPTGCTATENGRLCPSSTPTGNAWRSARRQDPITVNYTSEIFSCRGQALRLRHPRRRRRRGRQSPTSAPPKATVLEIQEPPRALPWLPHRNKTELQNGTHLSWNMQNSKGTRTTLALSCATIAGQYLSGPGVTVRG
jgi:hypothetical protein